MHRIPPGGIFDDPSDFIRRYQEAVQARDAAAAAAAPPESQPAPEVDGLSRRLSGVHLDGARGLAPRRSASTLGGSARLSSPAVRREDGYGSHSMRHDYGSWQPSPPESAPSSPEAANSEASDDDGPALVREPRSAVGHSMRAPASASLADDRRGGIRSARYEPPARQAPARAGFREPEAPGISTRRQRDPEAKRSGGILSFVAKSAKKLFGKGSSSKHSGATARVPARHSLDSSLSSATVSRMDSRSPGHGEPHNIRHDGVDARVTREDAPPAHSQAADSPVVPSDSWPGWRFDPGTPLDDAAGPSSRHASSGAAGEATARAEAPQPGQALGAERQPVAPVRGGRPPLAPASSRKDVSAQTTRTALLHKQDKLFITAFVNTPTMQNMPPIHREATRRSLSFLAGWLNAQGLGPLSSRVTDPQLQSLITACRFSADTPSEVRGKLPTAMRHLQRAGANGEIARHLPEAATEMKLDEFLDEYKSSLQSKKPLAPRSVTQYAAAVRNFHDWLVGRALGRLADYLPDHVETLRELLSQFIAAPEKPPATPLAALRALDKLLQEKSTGQPPARVAEPQPDMQPAHAAYGRSFSPMPEPSGGWPDFDLNTPAPEQEPAHPHHPARGVDSAVFGGLDPLTPPPWEQRWPASPAPEVTSAYRPPRQTDSAVFGGLESITSIPPLPAASPQEVTGPPRQTDSAVFGGLESFTSIPPLQGWTADPHQSQDEVTSAPRATAAGSSRAAPEVIDLDDYEPRQREEQPLLPATVRLQGNGWMHDNDFIHYGEAMASVIQGDLGEAGLARFNARVGIVDPALVRLLTGGTHQSPLALLHRHRAPILFLPVNNGMRDQPGTHWSLLVINRTPGAAVQAVHYDSLARPDWLANPQYAAMVANTPQYRIAAQATRIILGQRARPPMMGSIPMQRDGHSCGDHVVTGMEILAGRIVAGQDEAPIDMDLSGIQPSRARTLQMLGWHEAAYGQRAAAGAASSQRDTDSAPRRKRQSDTDAAPRRKRQ